MKADRRRLHGLDRGERAALLISECQNRNTDVSFGRGAIAEAATKRQIVAKISRLAIACRAVGVPVLIALHTPRSDYSGMKANCPLLHGVRSEGLMYEGSPMAELNPKLSVAETDWIFHRHQGLTDFAGSEIPQLLQNLGIDTVILTGVSTNVGVLGNVFDVVNRGWNAVVAEDCTAGTPQDHHDYMMRTTYKLMATIASSDEIIDAFVRQGVDN